MPGSAMKKAFTLIELLAVMAIMVLMSAVIIASYFGMTRGAAMRAATNHVFAALQQARQMAIMRGRATYIIFSQPAGPPPGEASLSICRHEGTTTEGSVGTTFTDKYTELDEIIAGVSVFNFDLAQSAKVERTENIDVNGITYKGIITDKSFWKEDMRFGFEVIPRMYLPKGIVFGESGKVAAPAPVGFGPDGTTLTGSGGAAPTNSIAFYELIAPQYVVSMEVTPTGDFNVRYKY